MKTVGGKPGWHNSGTVPRVSVVVAAYNGGRFLRPAIESLLKQTLRAFELIVVDDCSTDATSRILREFTDERMKVFRNEQNLGIAETTNKGIAAAVGEYIALQDHDDLSWPTRLESQVAFLDCHPQVGMLGSSCNVMDEDGNLVPHWPVEYEDMYLRWAILWRCPFFHTSIMLRRNAIQEVGGYSSDPKYRFSEDYEFMSRVAIRYAVANLPQLLACWRAHKASASHSHVSQQSSAMSAISQRNICQVLGWNHIDPVCWQGAQRFLFHPVREPLDLTSTEVNRTLEFLTAVHKAFCAKYNLGPRQAAAHRRRVLWPWGRHALALSYKRNGRRDAACRLSLLTRGTKLVLNAFRS